MLALFILVNLVLVVVVAGAIALEFTFQAFTATEPGQWLMLGVTIWGFLIAIALWVRRRAQSIAGIIILVVVVSMLTVAAYLFWNFLPQYNKDFMLRRLREEPLNFGINILVLIEITIIPVIVAISTRWQRFQQSVQKAYSSPLNFVLVIATMSIQILLLLVGIWFTMTVILPLVGIDLSQFDMSSALG